MDIKNNIINKNTLFIIFIFFLFYSKILNLSWDIIKNIFYIIIIIFIINYFNPSFISLFRNIINQLFDIIENSNKLNNINTQSNNINTPSNNINTPSNMLNYDYNITLKDNAQNIISYCAKLINSLMMYIYPYPHEKKITQSFDNQNYYNNKNYDTDENNINDLILLNESIKNLNNTQHNIINRHL